MNLAHNDFKTRWRCDAITCREENSEAFAGQHAAGSTSFYVFDEASVVPNKIFEVREGGTVLGEPMTFDFGNPTRNTGQFFENCKGRFRHRYKVRSIDSRNVFITNKDRIEEWKSDYGEDSDFFKVRVKGEFPSAGSVQFISGDDVTAAQKRELIYNKNAALVIGVDVARFGDDDSVIYPRIGDDARSFEIKIFNGIDTVQLVGRVIETIRYFKSLGIACSGLFVDGGGVGGGVVDQLRHLGYNPIEVQFGGKPTDTGTYRYKTDEMAGKMKEHIGTRLCLPAMNQKNGADLYGELTQREYGFTLANKLNLESKKDMKARGLPSPNKWDALALTYAEDVVLVPSELQGFFPKVQHEYNPLEVD